MSRTSILDLQSAPVEGRSANSSRLTVAATRAGSWTSTAVSPTAATRRMARPRSLPMACVLSRPRRRNLTLRRRIRHTTPTPRSRTTISLPICEISKIESAHRTLVRLARRPNIDGYETVAAAESLAEVLHTMRSEDESGFAECVEAASSRISSVANS